MSNSISVDGLQTQCLHCEHVFDAEDIEAMAGQMIFERYGLGAVERKASRAIHKKSDKVKT